VAGLAGTIGLTTQVADAAPAPQVVDAAPAALVPMATDRSNRTAVQNAYRNTLLPALATAIGWSGNKANCISKPTAQPASAAGAPSAATQAATLKAINYYRDMAGLSPVAENTTGSQYAQQAALIMHAAGKLEHAPDDTWPCWSSNGKAGAASSNLSIGEAGANAVVGQMNDHGERNQDVGHRRWILYPPLSQVGMGSTSNTMALKVFNTGTATSNARPSGGTAWPSAGYFPHEIYPNSGRWSYTLPSANFSAATVTVKKGSTTLATSVIARNGGYGDPALVWTVSGVTQPARGAVDTYTVTISGITGGSVTKATYNVLMFNAAEATVDHVYISGTTQVKSTLVANVDVKTPSDVALSYVWYRDGTTAVGYDRTYTLKVADAGHKITVKVTPSKTGWTSFPVTLSGVTINALPTVSGTVVNRQGSSVAGYSLAYHNVTCDSSHSLVNSYPISGTLTLSAGGAFSLKTTPGDCLRLLVSNSGTTLPAEVNGATNYYQYLSAGTSGAKLLVGKGSVTISSLSISGTPKVGNKLTAAPGTVKPANAYLAYTWWRGSTQVGSGSTYTPTGSDAGSAITLKATASYTESYSGIVWNAASASAVTGTVQPGTFTTVPTPTISGSATVGSRLTASLGTWVPTPNSYAYQWLRNGVAISGATNYYYYLTSADAGTTITVKVTATKTGYTTATSAASAGVTLPAWATVSGTVVHRQGASVNGWKLKYNNVACDAAHTDILNPSDIYGVLTLSAGGAFSVTLPPGECLNIRILDDNGWQARSTLDSADHVNHYPAAGTTGLRLLVGPGEATVASVSVTGTAQVGQTLTATVGAITPTWTSSDYAVTSSVAWYRGSAWVGSGTTYVVQPADVGSSLTVKATAKYSDWTTGTAQATTGVVQAGTLLLTRTGSITGDPNGLICAPNPQWSPTPDYRSYQWLRDEVPIAGATSSCYRPAAADWGGPYLRVEITAHKTGYVSNSWKSPIVGLKNPSPTPTPTPTPSKTPTPTAPSTVTPGLPPTAVPVPNPAGPATGTTPQGGYTPTMEWFTLSPDLDGDRYGEVLAVKASTGQLLRFGANAQGSTPVTGALLANGLCGQRVFGPGDWNGDGKADVVTVDRSGYMWLYAGNGHGTVGARTEIGHGWTPFRIIPAGDLTQDGANDMLAIDAQGRLWLYAGNGKGGWKGQPKQVGQGWVGLELYAAGDLNGDGMNDILAILPDSTLWAYSGRGNGTFSAPKQVGRGWGAFELAAGADLNGDGRADIVGRNNATGELFYYRGNGGGSFQAAIRIGTGW
jgi:uncharacterized protein YkwD